MAGQNTGAQAFTAADYRAQRLALDEQIRVADDDHHRAGYKQLLGEASQEDVDAAMVSLEALKAKSRTLDAAWGEVQRRQAGAVLDQRREEQRKILDDIHDRLRARSEAAVAVEEAARALGKAFSDYSTATSAVRSLGGRLFTGYAKDRNTGRETLSFIQSDLDSGRDVQLLSGLLFELGVDLSSGRPASDRFLYKEHGGLPDFVEGVNGRIRYRAAELCPDLQEEEETA